MSFKISQISLLIWVSVTSSISMLPSDRHGLSQDRKTHVRIAFNISSPDHQIVTQKTLFIEHNIMSMMKSYKIYESIRSDNPGQDQFVISGPLIHTFSGTGSSIRDLKNDACSPIINSPKSQLNWVALFNDENCSQADKSKHVQEVGAQATIMYSTDSSSKKSRVVSVADKEDRPLISVFISNSEIKSILSGCYNSSFPFNIHSTSNTANETPERKINWSLCNVTIDVYRTNRENFLNRTSVLFVSVSFILLMIISLAWLVFYYVQRFRYIHVKEEYARRVARLAKKAVAKIELKHIKAGDKETDPEYDQCIICIEPYKVSDSVRILPCKHYFHKSCIDPWLLDQRNCPICKMNILQHFGMIPGDSSSVMSDRDSDPNFGVAIALNNHNSPNGDNYEVVSGGETSRPDSRITLMQFIRSRWLRWRNSSPNQLGSRGTYHLTGSIPTSAIIPNRDDNQPDSHSSTSAPAADLSLGRTSLNLSSQSSLDADQNVSPAPGDKEVVCLRVQLERTPVNSQIVDETSLNASSEATVYPTTNSVVG